ncbi:Endoplasmic Reticulum Oxidoreductin 1 (ERO1) domain containing protein [Elaphomyces granulatus]
MRSAARLFYLAVFTLFNHAHAGKDGSGSSPYSGNICAIDPKATVSDTCASYATIDAMNDQVFPLLRSITQETDFFSYYRLNLFNKVCPFWSEEGGMCGNIACAVNTIDSEDDIPPIWRVEELSKLEGPKAGHPGPKLQAERPKSKPLQGMLGEDVGESCVVEYDDECDERDYCIPEDEGAAAKGDYVSLVDNPERFTGYSGSGAHRVWDAIYRENCFVKALPQPQTPLISPLQGLQAVHDFRSVLHKEMQRSDILPLDNECMEKRVFHRIVSGMHASISTHLCWDYFNQETEEWMPNVQCYKDRLHSHPEWISNLYFNYALVSRAAAKLQKHLREYTFCGSDPEQDVDTKQKVMALTDLLASRPQIFDETAMFQDPSTAGLKEDFRNRFRNVSRLMDCIGCDKCRLWGKLQVNGYGTALKVLFDYDETKNGENPRLRRTELVALINTLGRISNSLAAVRSFRHAVESGREHNIVIHPPVSSPSQDSSGKREPGAARYYKDGGTTFYVEDNDRDFGYEEERPWEGREYHDNFLDNVKAEIRLVWRTYVWVLKSWISLPKTIWDISVLELSRLWNYWLGLPVQPRSWRLQFPSPDEL